MKITRSQLKQIIKEELQELEQPDQPAQQAGPKVASDVARVGKKLDRLQGFERLLASINTRPEFEQLLTQFIQMVAKERLQPNDVKAGLRKVLAKFLGDEANR